MRLVLFIYMIGSFAASLVAQQQSSKHWYENIHFGGYMQVRYNGLFETNPDLGCEQCDEHWGADGGGFSLRRLRFKFYGQISPKIYMYIQPDFAKSVGKSKHIAKLKDAYVDIGLDAYNTFRIRLGQSKVPFGFENMQSSADRLPLDRNDALNSAVKDERDLGLFLYWASREKRKLMKTLKPYKHSGDFGVFAFGIYNGQTANHADLNDQFHIVSRFSYPMVTGNQVIEPGIQAYTGRYVITGHSPEIEVKPEGYIDQRLALSFVLYPKPFGIQTEYNIGRGPEYDRKTNSIQIQPLQGGYATFSWCLEKGEQQVIPFVRLQYYDGGKKHESDARSYTVHEAEFGIEWHPFTHFELAAQYTLSDRRYEDAEHPVNHQTGSLVRIQAQLKF